MKNKKVFLALLIVSCLCLIIGSTYAFFNYSKTSTTNSELVTGEVYFNFNNESNGIVLTNAFPMSATEARTRTDNTFTFDIVGRNTYSMPIYYEIDLIDGDVPTGYVEANRILPEYLRFDLMEGETLVADNINYSELSEQKIWVNTIDANTSSNLTRSYTLRMWIDEDLLISDTDEDAVYTTGAYESLFASIKVRVVGDFDERTLTPPVYYAFADIGEMSESYEDFFSADTDIMTIPGITDNYTTIEHNVFIKFEGLEKSVCVIIDNKLECFKNNNLENEKAHLQSIFGETSCHNYIYGLECADDTWGFGIYEDGEVNGIILSTSSTCAVTADGSFGCKRSG